jgi:transcriptional regulator MraZ
MEGFQELLMIEPPRGAYPARLDDKGRLKLPADFQQFFSALREKKLFVTSLDGRTAQVYPMQVWRQNEKFFENYREDPETARRMAFRAAHYGGEAEMDGQGRILVPPELRRKLGIENQPVRIYAYRGHISVLSEPVYEQYVQESEQLTAGDLGKLEMAGLI